MSDENYVDGSWWDAAVARQGHTGWADQQVYAYDQPVRRACVARAIEAAFPRSLAGLDAADVGCGTGDFTLLLAARGARVLAIDFSAAVLEVARRRGAHLGTAVRFECASATQIPAANASFDLVTSITVLQHLVRDADLRLGVSELARVLRPKGRAVILELAPPLDAPNLSSQGHVIERPLQAWRAAFEGGGLTIEREFAYPQYGITTLRLLARAIDRMRGTSGEQSGAAVEVGVETAPGFKRRMLRGSLWLLRSILLALAWPFDHLLRMQVPAGQRYYRLWILRKQGLNQT